MADITTYLGLEKPIGGEKHSRAMINRNYDRVEANGLDDSKRPMGLVYEKKVTGNSAATADAIIENIASFTFKANRKYRIVWDASYLQGGVGSLFFCTINTAPLADAANLTTNLTILRGATKGVNGLANSTQYTGPITFAHFRPLVDTTTQIKFRIMRVVGGDLMTVVGNTGEEAFYQIYDEGAQTL